MPLIPEPLSQLTDQNLYDAQLALALACGRSKSVTKEKHRTIICFLWRILSDEADNRGSSKPAWPYRA